MQPCDRWIDGKGNAEEAAEQDAKFSEPTE